MQRRQLGASSLTATPLGLGLAALGRPGYITLGHNADIEDTRVEAMEAQAHDVLDAAWEFGIRYFDAARSYGRAEQFLGSWLKSRGIAPDDVTVGSKWGYTYTADWRVDADTHEVKEHAIEVLNRQWDETQANLGEYLDLYQIHSATLSSGVLDNGAVINRLFELKRGGTAIGLTLSGAGQADTLARALTVKQDDELLFDTVQATWNILEPSVGPELEKAHAAGLGVLIKEVLANGRLTPRSAADPNFADTYRVLLAQAARLETTVDALAVAYALRQPWAGVVLSGAANRVQLTSNAAALNLTLDDEAAAALAPLAEEPESYWNTRSSLPWN